MVEYTVKADIVFRVDEEGDPPYRIRDVHFILEPPEAGGANKTMKALLWSDVFQAVKLYLHENAALQGRWWEARK